MHERARHLQSCLNSSTASLGSTVQCIKLNRSFKQLKLKHMQKHWLKVAKNVLKVLGGNADVYTETALRAY